MIAGRRLLCPAALGGFGVLPLFKVCRTSFIFFNKSKIGIL
jgi:hypothetical protein